MYLGRYRIENNEYIIATCTLLVSILSSAFEIRTRTSDYWALKSQVCDQSGLSFSHTYISSCFLEFQGTEITSRCWSCSLQPTTPYYYEQYPLTFVRVEFQRTSTSDCCETLEIIINVYIFFSKYPSFTFISLCWSQFSSCFCFVVSILFFVHVFLSLKSQ